MFSSSLPGLETLLHRLQKPLRWIVRRLSQTLFSDARLVILDLVVDVFSSGGVLLPTSLRCRLQISIAVFTVIASHDDKGNRFLSR